MLRKIFLPHTFLRCSAEASRGAESAWREMARCQRHVTLIWLLGLPAERPMSHSVRQRCYFRRRILDVHLPHHALNAETQRGGFAW